MKKSVYSLRISLQGIQPEIWRTCKVAGKTSFGELHEVIQIVMGWDNLHDFRYELGDTIVFDDPSEPTLDGKTAIDSDDLNIQDALKEVGAECTYFYKKSNWAHTVQVAQIEHEQSIPCPRCTGGQYQTPPESTTVEKYSSRISKMSENELNALSRFETNSINDFLQDCHDLGE